MNQKLFKIPLKENLALWISLFGHPAVIIPITVTLLSWKGDTTSKLRILIPILVLITVLMIFSHWQVRRGRWRDMNASQPSERKTLLIALVVCLLAALFITSIRIFPSGLAIGMFVSGLQVVAAIIASRWLKVSFHSAFNAFCSLLLIPLGVIAVTIGFIWTAIVSWSRVVLDRHTFLEVFIGTGLGVGGGLLFWLLSQRLIIK